MKHPNDFGLQDVYSYETSNDLRNYYNDWAHAYDDFVTQTGYILPDKLADFITESVQEHEVMNVLDIGCGTGVLGKAVGDVLPNLIIDGIDISSSMLHIAKQVVDKSGKKYYATLYEADVTQSIPCPVNHYELLISAGTFTPGHLDSNHLFSFMPYLKKHGAVFISVNKQHYVEMNFAEKISQAQSAGIIDGFAYREVEAWDNENYSMKATLLFFVKM